MSKKTFICLALLSALLASCSKYAPYFTQDVEIEINVAQRSYSFIEVDFKLNKSAYYFVDVIPFHPDEINPDSLGDNFAMLRLDSALIEYMDWRHDLLTVGTEDIASFADHGLFYGNTRNYFTDLKKDSTYLVYAFVVDPHRLTPVGKVFHKIVRTDQMVDKKVFFNVVCDDAWDFVYPIDSNGMIEPNIPYYTLIASEGEIKKDSFGDSPFLYFVTRMTSYIEDRLPDKYYFGVSMRRHDNPSDTNNVFFEEDSTYYIGIGSTDVFYENKGVTVYRLKYRHDIGTKYFYYDRDALNVYEW